jgi:NAD(P)H dehydrogenase (quinone)
MAERVFEWSGLAVTHLQPTFFAGWFLYYAQSIKDGLVQMPFGESKHAPIAEEDQARVIVSILENPSAHKGKTYQLFGPKEYTCPEAFAVISGILGHKITYERISLEAYREWLQIPETVNSSAKTESQPWFIKKRRNPFTAQHLFEVVQDHAAGVFSGTNDVIEKITGHRPLGLEEFIRKHRSAFE